MIKYGKLTTLEPHRNDFLSQLEDTPYEVFLDSIKNSPLTSISLSGNKLETLSLARWQHLLDIIQTKNPPLTSLALIDCHLNQLDNDQWEIFLNFIKTSHLTSLNLNKNDLEEIAPQRGEAFLDAMRHNLYLTSLLIEEKNEFQPILELLERNEILLMSSDLASLKGKLDEINLSKDEEIQGLLHFSKFYQEALKNVMQLNLPKETLSRFCREEAEFLRTVASWVSETDESEIPLALYQEETKSLQAAAAWLIQQGEQQDAIEHLLTISPKNPNYAQLHFDAAMDLYMARYHDILQEKEINQEPINHTSIARKALIEALNCCLDEEGTLLNCPDKQKNALNGFLFAAVGIKTAPAQAHQLTDAQRIVFLKYLLLVEMQSSNTAPSPSVQPTTLFHQRQAGLHDQLQRLPHLASLADLTEKNVRFIDAAWEKAAILLNDNNPLSSLFSAISKANKQTIGSPSLSRK